MSTKNNRYVVHTPIMTCVGHYIHIVEAATPAEALDKIRGNSDLYTASVRVQETKPNHDAAKVVSINSVLVENNETH